MPAVIVKLNELDPAGTVIVAGSVSRLSLLESATVVPLPDTVKFRVTVQVVVPAEFNDVETQVTEDTVLVADTGNVTELLT